MNRDEISLRRFEWLIKQRGYIYDREEQVFRKLPRRTKEPDFYVEPTNNPAFLIEVESFEKETVLRTAKSRVFSLDRMVLQKRINRAVRRAADQLEPYADISLPLVIVLDNHRKVGLPLGFHELVSLFGEQNFTFTIDAEVGEMVGQPTIEHQEDGSPFAGGERSYISAVLVNEPEYRFDSSNAGDDFTIERPMRVRVIHHPFALMPFPFSVFQGPDDEHITYRDGRWRKI